MTGDDLRTWRTDRGLTLAQLAEQLGVPLNTLWRWERGRLTIAQPVMLDLALCELERRRVEGSETGGDVRQPTPTE